MAGKPGFSARGDFGRWVVWDLRKAGCRIEQLNAVVLATVSTTIAFLRNYRREVLATNPTLSQLAKHQFDFENRLLASVARALPKSPKRGRRKDPATIETFLRIMELINRGKTWSEITKELQAKGHYASESAYKKLYARHLRPGLKVWLSFFNPDADAKVLRLLIRAAKRPPGRRPKKSGH